MIFFIDSNSRSEVKFILSNKQGDILFSKIYDVPFKCSGDILMYLEDFLNLNNVELNDLKGIIVNNGVGISINFKIGIIIVNTLGYVLNVPMAGVLGSEFEDDDGFVKIGLERLKKNKVYKAIVPVYKVVESKK